MQATDSEMRVESYVPAPFISGDDRYLGNRY